MDVVGLISDFATGTYTVSRRTKALIVRGRAVPATATTFTAVASVQPASGRDLLRLPEGRRSEETRVIYTTTQLYPGTQAGAYEADQISINGISWEVQHVETWAESPESEPTFYRCIAQAIG